LKIDLRVSDVGVCAVRGADGGVDDHLLADVAALQVRDQRHRGLGRRHLGQEARQRRLLLRRRSQGLIFPSASVICIK
jgi:ABC-type molybdate transport system ATPase subunit